MRPYCITAAIALALSFVTAEIAAAAPADPGRIDAYVTPYYNPTGPVVDVGKYSSGLASKNESEVVATIRQMKQQWSRLNFPQLYVGAIRLYDLGYRREATYWFYSAQYKGRQFMMLADRAKLGSMGNSGFELYQAANAFFEVVGPQINGYAFGDTDSLIPIIRRVQSENRTVPDLPSIYPHVAFTDRKQWQQANAALNAGLDKLVTYLTEQKTQITQQRIQNGTQALYAHVQSRQFPGGL